MSTLPSLLNMDAIKPLPQLQSEHDFEQAIGHFKAHAEKASEENRCLETILNTAAKNLPAYIKIVKSHLEQLASVLKLDSHQNQHLDYLELPEPLKQLVQLFQHLTEDDITQIEWLSREAQNWHTAPAIAGDKTLTPLTEGA